MGMRRVVIPPSPGLVSAFGAVIADERVDRRATVVRRLDRPEAADVAAELGRLAEIVATELAAQRRRADGSIQVMTHVACRYLGQNYEQEVRMYAGHVDKTFELAIQIAPDAPRFVERLIDGFHAVHKAAYGYNLPDQPVQSVYLGATALVTADSVDVRPYSAGPLGPTAGTRRVLARTGEWADAAILRRDELPIGFSVRGPAIIEEPDSTTFVPPEYACRVDPTWCLILETAEAAR